MALALALLTSLTLAAVRTLAALAARVQAVSAHAAIMPARTRVVAVRTSVTCARAARPPQPRIAAIDLDPAVDPSGSILVSSGILSLYSPGLTALAVRLRQPEAVVCVDDSTRCVGAQGATHSVVTVPLRESDVVVTSTPWPAAGTKRA